MLQTNPQTDPIVEILRLAYRRGLAIREKLAEQNQTIETTNSDTRTEEEPTSLESEQNERTRERQ
jgi:hypothetical protein